MSLTQLVYFPLKLPRFLFSVYYILAQLLCTNKQHLVLLTSFSWFWSCRDYALQSFWVLVARQSWVLTAPLSPETSEWSQKSWGSMALPSHQGAGSGHRAQGSSAPGQAGWQWRHGAQTCSAVWLRCPGRQGGLGSIWTQRSPPGRTWMSLSRLNRKEHLCILRLGERRGACSILLSCSFPPHG